METTEGYRLYLTQTARGIAARNGWGVEDILDTFNGPKKIYESKQREGQWRIAGKKIVIVGYPDHDEKCFRGITLIVNGSAAPKGDK